MYLNLLRGFTLMHPCSDLPQGILLEDINTLDIIENRYAVSLSFLGKGAFGNVLSLDDIQIKGKPSIAVKIIQYESKSMTTNELSMKLAKKELENGCLLNNLKTFAFINTYGWLISSKIPTVWIPYINQEVYQNPKSYLFLFMEQSNYEFDSESLHFDREGYLRILFLLLYGLYVAIRELGFKHADIHDGNIMIDKTFEQSLTVEIDFQAFQIDLPNHYIPKFIDFGLSSVEDRKNRESVDSDMFYLFQTVINRARKYDPMVNLEDIANFDDFDDGSIEYILLDPIFDPIRKKVNVKADRKCSMCGADAKVKWNVNNQYVFCNLFCANKVNGIIDLVGNL